MMKTVPVSTSWGTISLELNSAGQVTACDLPPLEKEPGIPFAFSDPAFQTIDELVATFSIPGIPDGTDFQRAVWQAIADIPRGQTRTYGEIAESIGRPKAVRAVGSACGANPLPLLIPCHRVTARNGLGGFGSGLPWKKLLLASEKD